MVNHFAELGLQPTCVISREKLLFQYVRLQKLVFEPDQQLQINRSYGVVKNAGTRALHFLEVHGITVPHDFAVDKGFLIEMFELQQKIELLVGQDLLDELQLVRDEINNQINQLLTYIETCVQKKDNDVAILMCIKIKYLIVALNGLHI